MFLMVFHPNFREEYFDGSLNPPISHWARRWHFGSWASKMAWFGSYGLGVPHPARCCNCATRKYNFVRGTAKPPPSFSNCKMNKWILGFLPFHVKMRKRQLMLLNKLLVIHTGQICKIYNSCGTQIFLMRFVRLTTDRLWFFISNLVKRGCRLYFKSSSLGWNQTKETCLSPFATTRSLEFGRVLHHISTSTEKSGKKDTLKLNFNRSFCASHGENFVMV